MFLALLWLPLVGQFTGWGVSDGRTENRRATSFPTLEWKPLGPLSWPRKRSLQAFPAAFESFYNDNFGFRRPLLRTYNRAVAAGVMPGLIASSAGKPRPEAPALVGQHGWIYCTRDDDIETYRCARGWSKPQLAQWSRALLERRAWLADRGMGYLFVAAPSKLAIYPEYLPRTIQRVGGVSRVQQLAAELKRRGQPEMFLDLYAALVAAKVEHPGHPCYYRTDTHWNEFGGFHGYRAVVQQLQRWYPQVRPARLTDFEVHSQEGQSLALAELMDIADLFTDTHIRLEPRRPRQAQMASSAHDLKQVVATNVSVNPNVPSGRVVVLHDSFMLAMQPHLNEHFREVHYYWTRDFPLEEIERLKPDVVIQEMVEQMMTGHWPENPSEMSIPAEPLELARQREPIQR